jgi:hypothetical protein
MKPKFRIKVNVKGRIRAYNLHFRQEYRRIRLSIVADTNVL